MYNEILKFGAMIVDALVECLMRVYLSISRCVNITQRNKYIPRSCLTPAFGPKQ